MPRFLFRIVFSLFTETICSYESLHTTELARSSWLRRSLEMFLCWCDKSWFWLPTHPSTTEMTYWKHFRTKIGGNVVALVSTIRPTRHSCWLGRFVVVNLWNWRGVFESDPRFSIFQGSTFLAIFESIHRYRSSSSIVTANWRGN